MSTDERQDVLVYGIVLFFENCFIKMKNKLRVERARHRMSMQQLADEVHVTRQTIHAIEHNEHSPALSLAMQIAWVFDKQVSELFSMDESDKEGYVQRERLVD